MFNIHKIRTIDCSVSVQCTLAKWELAEKRKKARRKTIILLGQTKRIDYSFIKQQQQQYCFAAMDACRPSHTIALACIKFTQSTHSVGKIEPFLHLDDEQQKQKCIFRH